MEHIKFYRVNDAYGFFSNFSPHVILVNSLFWPTVEHYFQACKFDDYKIQDKIRELDSPMKAAIEGRDVKNKIKENWNEIKDKCMFRGVEAKFLQHHKLKSELLKTGDAIIVEHTVNDNYWGDGGDGTGQNKLGKILMEVRANIRKISPDSQLVFPPWIAFPNVSKYDMFWRMGGGEDYISDWVAYFNTCNKDAYKEQFPPLDEWEGFYQE